MKTRRPGRKCILRDHSLHEKNKATHEQATQYPTSHKTGNNHRDFDRNSNPPSDVQIPRPLDHPHVPHRVSRKHKSRITIRPLRNASKRAATGRLNTAHIHAGLPVLAHFNQRALWQSLNRAPPRLLAHLLFSLRHAAHSKQNQ